MRTSDVIARLRAECPIFANRVAGAASFKAALDNPDLQVPHAFVLLQGITGGGETQLSGIDQEMTVSLSVVVAVSNTADLRGQDAGEQLLDCFCEVRDALLGWTPDPERFGVIFVDGLSLDEATYTRARAFAQIDISSAAMVRDIS